MNLNAMALGQSHQREQQAVQIGAKRRRNKEEEVLGWQDFLFLRNMERSTEGKTFFAASASTGSSKPIGFSRDEDRFEVARLPRLRNGVRESVQSFANSFFAAVFDGHGGTQVSQFAKDHLRDEFFRRFESSVSDNEIPEMLKESFLSVDSDLYEHLLEARRTTDKTKEQDCSCKFFLENPCRCLEATRQARTGSTGTAVVLKNNILYVANIGDTEACLFSYQKVKEKNKKVSTDLINQSTSSPLYKELQTLQSEGLGDNASRIDILKTKLLKSFVELFSQEKHANRTKPTIINLTKNHTPTYDNHEDYARIASIAIKRQIEFAAEGRHFDFSDGIKKGVEERNNYVRFPGAHSLNMTRAFGNFGHKVYNSVGRKHKVDELNSPVLPIPNISYFNLADCDNECFLVVASDGLWDNVSKAEVYQYVLRHVKKHLVKVWKVVEGDSKYKKSSAKVKAEVVLGILASNVSRGLTRMATSAKKKLDDVTVVVVLFNSILSAFL